MSNKIKYNDSKTIMRDTQENIILGYILVIASTCLFATIFYLEKEFQFGILIFFIIFFASSLFVATSKEEFIINGETKEIKIIRKSILPK
jgi:tryptophan-rich sensory protein